MNKCSKSLTLIIMAGLVCSSGGCSDSKEAEEFRAFHSVNECVNEGGYSFDECSEMQTRALAQLPRFQNVAECEQEFGVENCVPAQGKSLESPEAISQQGSAAAASHSSWMPLMAGYMMGRFLSGGSYYQGSQPLFRNPGQQADGKPGYRTSSGSVVRPDASGRVNRPDASIRKGFVSSAKPLNTRGSAVSKGGFSGKRQFGLGVGS